MMTLELKLIMQIAQAQGSPLYAIFLDLQKAFDAVDRSRLLDILKAYQVPPGCLLLQPEAGGLLLRLPRLGLLGGEGNHQRGPPCPHPLQYPHRRGGPSLG